MSALRYWAASPLTPRRIAQAVLQLVVLTVATAALWLVLAATATPAEAPDLRPLHELTETDTTTETTGRGGAL